MNFQKKRFVLWSMLIVSLSILFYFFLAGLSTRPSRVVQELCLLNLRDYVFVKNGADWNIQSDIECILTIPFFSERSPETFIAIQPSVKPPRKTGIIVFNTKYNEKSQDWVAIYIGSDIESRIKGHLILLNNHSLNRTRNLDIIKTNSDYLKYYRVNE